MIANRHQLLIVKNKKTIPHIAVLEKLATKVQKKTPKNFIVTIGYFIQINMQVRTKMNESGLCKNNVSDVALQQNTIKLTIGGHKSVNPLITKLTFSLTR